MDDWRKFLEAVAKAIKKEQEMYGDTESIRRMWDNVRKQMDEEGDA